MLRLVVCGGAVFAIVTPATSQSPDLYVFQGFPHKPLVCALFQHLILCVIIKSLHHDLCFPRKGHQVVLIRCKDVKCL